MDKNQEIDLHERVACLEITTKQTSEDVKLIMSNHLPHIQASVVETQTSVGEIKNKMAYYAGIGVAVMVIFNILVSIAIKLWV